MTELFDMAPYFHQALARRVAASSDGERFLLLKTRVDQTAGNEGSLPQITVVLNWTQELLERVPVP